MRLMLVATLLLAGCASPIPRSRPMPEGTAAPRPLQMYDFCLRHLHDARCQPT